MTPKQLRDATHWLDEAFARHKAARSKALDAEIAYNRRHPKPLPNPKLIQGGGPAAWDRGQSDGVLGLSMNDIRGRK